jgi:hypothetical protein
MTGAVNIHSRGSVVDGGATVVMTITTVGYHLSDYYVSHGFEYVGTQQVEAITFSTFST